MAMRQNYNIEFLKFCEKAGVHLFFYLLNVLSIKTALHLESSIEVSNFTGTISIEVNNVDSAGKARS